MNKMRCDDVDELLSAYYDGELDGATAAAVQNHVAACEVCKSQLRGFEQLTQVVGASQSRVPSRSAAPPTWEEFLAAVDLQRAGRGPVADSADSKVRRSSRFSRSRFAVVLTLAASALIALMWTGRETEGLQSPGRELNPRISTQASVAGGAIDLSAVAAGFSRGANAAVATLTQQTGMRQAAAGGSPPATVFGSQPVAVHTFAFASCQCGPGECTCGPGGCRCVACVYRRADDSEFLVLEHCPGHPVSFGTMAHRQRLQGNTLVQEAASSGQQVASWQAAGRRFTAVGLKDTAEVNSLLAATTPTL